MVDYLLALGSSRTSKCLVIRHIVSEISCVAHQLCRASQVNSLSVFALNTCFDVWLQISWCLCCLFLLCGLISCALPLWCSKNTFPLGPLNYFDFIMLSLTGRLCFSLFLCLCPPQTAFLCLKYFHLTCWLLKSPFVFGFRCKLFAL